jgi:hypothetical protein
MKRTPRVLPFRPKAQPSIFDVPGGLKLNVSVTVERVSSEVRLTPNRDRRRSTLVTDRPGRYTKE